MPPPARSALNANSPHEGCTVSDPLVIRPQQVTELSRDLYAPTPVSRSFVRPFDEGADHKIV